MKDQLLSKIHDHTAVVAVIGLGYVGLPLAVAFAEKGFSVVGIEVDGRKVAAVQRGESYVQDSPSERLAALTNDERRTTNDGGPSAISHQPSALGDDVRESPALDVIELLRQKGA
ncbi:MAG: NAD(P)-binding domain-containing protein, partial [Anaerolineae bacterium]